MEGQTERGKQKQAEEVIERKQNYFKTEMGSQDLAEKLNSVMESDSIPYESRLRVSIYTRHEIVAETAGLGTDDLLKLAKEKGWKMAIYNPGVAWTGDQWSKREVRDNPLFEKVKRNISREEKTEEEAKSAALDFLAEGGFDLAVTFDPVKEKGFVSSLRADMLARRETIKKVGTTLGKGKLNIVSWSNGGHKEFQIHRAALETIALNKSDSMGIFKTVDEAEKYISLHGEHQVDIFLGGAPANEIELATPFKLISENAGVKTINEAGMKLVNWLIKGASGLPNKYIPDKFRLLGSRVLEMGRGQRVNDIEADNLEQLQQKMRGLLEGARILSLADTSGEVVASDRQFVGDDLRAIYGDRVIMVETHDNKPLPKMEVGGGVIFGDMSPAQHGELKRFGVLPRLIQIMEEIRMGTFNQARNEQERHVVVQSEARIYEQKKGTQLRLNPLPQLGRSLE